MSRRFWSAFAALLLATLGVAVVAAPPSAQADPSVATFPWPSTPLPASSIFTHGDGSFTVAPFNANCGTYGGTTTTDVTMSSDGSTLGTIYGSSNGWSLCAGQYETAIGSDQTIYTVQYQVTTGAQRLVAERGNTILWIRDFPTGSCYSSQPQLYNPVLGFDGNIYVEVQWGDWSPCVGKLDLVGINSATGEIRAETTLPNRVTDHNNSLYTDDLMPYSNGIAVANNGVNVYYYSYSGVLDGSKTFSPSGLGTDPRPQYASITANGRVYLNAYGSNPDGSINVKLFYKDTDSSTIHEVPTPSGRRFSNVYSTPNGMVDLLLNTSDLTHYYLGYFDQNGSEIYEKDLSAFEGNFYMPSPARPILAVDSQGNAIVVRRMLKGTSPYDQEIYVDAFDTSGTKTRLFDSEAQFGTAGQDVFTSVNANAQMPGIIGNGKIYLVLCHSTSGSATYCTSDANPQIVVIPAPGSYDYPRSAAFTAINALPQYMALGDSYSSAEGNPPFITPTDNNGGDGCDRSQSSAYPVLLPADTGLSLRAFVACSGATSSDVINGKNGEPSQLSSLDAHTSIVTITAGGDDAKFSDFAEECVIGTCDSGSAQYQTTMEIINDPLLLQAYLETLFTDMRTAAPNAAIKVVGYPEVVASGGSCPVYLSSGEQIAIETVVTGLNNAIRAAVNNSGTGFQFIDPTMAGSPFEGHDLCSADPYFFGLNIAEHRFSFHPNANGQIAYEELIANLI